MLHSSLSWLAVHKISKSVIEALQEIAPYNRIAVYIDLSWQICHEFLAVVAVQMLIMERSIQPLSQRSEYQNYGTYADKTETQNSPTSNWLRFVNLRDRSSVQAQGTSLRTRLPITIRHLNLFCYLLAIPHTSNPDSVMIWAAMTFAFFGFLRLGELTCNSGFSADIHLSPADITFLPSISNPDYISARSNQSF